MIKNFELFKYQQFLLEWDRSEGMVVNGYGNWITVAYVDTDYYQQEGRAHLGEDVGYPNRIYNHKHAVIVRMLPNQIV